MLSYTTCRSNTVSGSKQHQLGLQATKLKERGDTEIDVQERTLEPSLEGEEKGQAGSPGCM